MNKTGSDAAALGLFYGALFIVYGTHVPYMPVWLDWKGLTAGEISAVMAAPFFVRLVVTPLVALHADRTGTHRRTLAVLAALGLALVLALSQMRTFWPILVLTVALIASNSTMMPLTETIAVQLMRRQGLDYGRMRLWGSLTFVAASFLGGMAIEAYGGGSGIWLIAVGCLATVCAAWLLPRGDTHVTGPDAASAPLWHASEIRTLLGDRTFRIFLVTAGLTMAAHATFLTFGTLLWQKQGLSGVLIGSLWAIGVGVEVMLFSMSGALAARFGAARLLAAGAFTSLLRWLLMACDPPLAALVPLTALHGVTYGATHIGAIHFINAAVPRSATGSAQALYATIASGVAMGAATLIGGYIYARAGGLSYLAMAAIAAMASVAALLLVRSGSTNRQMTGPQAPQPQSLGPGG